MEAEGMFHFPVGPETGINTSDPTGENEDEPPGSRPAASTVIPFPFEAGIPTP